MKPYFYTNSIRTKLTVLGVLLVVLISTILGLTIGSISERVSIRDEKHIAGNLVADLAERITQPLLSRDLSQLKEFANSFAGFSHFGEEHMGIVMVIDDSGNLLAQNNLERLDKQLQDALIRKAVKIERPHILLAGKHKYEVIAPVEKDGRRLGTVIMEYRLGHRAESITHMWQVFLIVLIILVAVAILGCFAFANTITEPIQKLADATARVSRGELDVEVAVESKDEIGELASSFNKMTTDLRDTTVSRDLLIKEVAVRKQTEVALRNGEEKLAAILESVTDTMLMVDDQYNVVWNNHIAMEVFGADMSGKKCYSAFHGYDKPCEPCIVKQCFEDCKVHEFETQISIADSDPKTFWCTASVSAWSENGHPKMAVEFLRDITYRKRAEEALRESEQKYRTITGAAQDAILMMDNKGNISYWNPAAEKMFGYTPEEIIGRELHIVLSPQRYQEDYRKGFKKFKETGQGLAVGKVLEVEAIRKDGTEFPIELSLSAIQIKGKWHAMGILRDITERKEADGALRKAKDQLEQRVNERTAELVTINDQLEKAIARANVMTAQAEMANIAKSKFLANMSHEIRTPMNGVIGMTGLLIDTDLNDEQLRYAETVRTSGESLLKLINDILDFSKIEAKKLDLEETDFDIRAMMDDFAATMAFHAEEKGLAFICAFEPEIPTFLKGDPGRLRQILTNLAGNAVKFTSEGKITVRASLVTETDEEAVLRFSVRDTGIGIPENKQGMLFQSFSQVDTSTTRKSGGTGLGLVISKQLSEMMHGKIGVNSEDGKGSEFWFTVCLAKQPERECDEISPAEITGARILVVEDNAAKREVLMAQLESYGVRPTEAQDGSTAMQTLYQAREAGDPFQVAMVDMQMPGMDGEALGLAIKTDEKLKDTRLMMMTSIGWRGDAERLHEIGVAAYMTKPVRKSDLFDSLAAVLTSKTAQRIVTRHSIREIRRRNIRILLAEDNVTNQQVAVGILKKLGLRVDVVANGAEAVKALEDLPYDLVFMDVQMPELDGLEATRIIRNRKPESAEQGDQALNSKYRASNVPIVAITAHAMKGDREKCLEAGMDDYISKPVTPQALSEVLEKWLSKEGDDSGDVSAGDTGKTGHTQAPEQRKVAVPVFDKTSLMDRLMGDEELMQTMIKGFLEDVPRQIEALKGYLQTDAVASAERQAHSIKGAAATVGGNALYEVALEMEKAGKVGDLEAVTARLPDLVKHFNSLKEVMEKEIT